MRPVVPLLSDEFVTDVGDELRMRGVRVELRLEEVFATYRAAPPSEAAFAELHAALGALGKAQDVAPARAEHSRRPLAVVDGPHETRSLVGNRWVGEAWFVGRLVLLRPLSDPHVRGRERLGLPAACGSFLAVLEAAQAELARREGRGLPAIAWTDALQLVEDRALPRGWDAGRVEVLPAAWRCEPAIDEAARAEEERRTREWTAPALASPAGAALARPHAAALRGR